MGTAFGQHSVKGSNIVIDPNTPVKDLLPPSPDASAPSGPLAAEDLSKVHEVEFQRGSDKSGQSQSERVATQLAKARFLDTVRTDGFVLALHANRSDLTGIPFVMGDECRSNHERARYLAEAVDDIRIALPPSEPRSDFWSTLTKDWQGKREKVFGRPEITRPTESARIAALMQILADESAELKVGLVKYLSDIEGPEATQALARLVLFTGEDKVRSAAVDALRSRRADEYAFLLIAGLKYPFPAVAKRASEAIAKLQRVELVDDLVSVLDRPDPRAPEVREFAGKTGPVVRELVRINHLKSCLMCHAADNGARGALVANRPASVPIPGDKLPRTYQSRRVSPDLAIRFDVTYLRQDFSAKLPVANAKPWPDLQRFDFLVRERLLSEDEAAAFTAALAPNGDGSPYRQAALAALKELTGKDLSAAAWRESRGSRGKP